MIFTTEWNCPSAFCMGQFAALGGSATCHKALTRFGKAGRVALRRPLRAIRLIRLILSKHAFPRKAFGVRVLFASGAATVFRGKAPLFRCGSVSSIRPILYILSKSIFSCGWRVFNKNNRNFLELCETF
jgi:hypothetical protein